MAKGCCFLFLGPELGEKEDAVNELRQSLTPKGGDAPEETSFYAGETTVGDMVAALRNGSIFSYTRLFFIKNAEALKKKEEVELLASYMGSPQENTTLVLLSESTSLDKGLEKTVPRTGKRIFWELFEEKKAPWVASFFERAGCRISEEGVEVILEMVENNTEALRRECSRLILFLGNKGVITLEDAEKWLAHSREESAFTLFSRIAQGDLEKGIESLRTLLGAKEAPPAILAGLSWCFRKLGAYLSLVKAGNTDEFEMKKIGLASAKVRRDYIRAGQLYDLPATDRCLSLIAEYDVLLRAAGTAFETILMDTLLYKIYVQGRGKGIPFV
ncbi:MAG: DNA polymerase III subunit delta [Treponema sp.]|jgi:DNA polymerase-3 subunit delta|nr:DNA polymerase III subunit delta [Treponema sp.]